MLTNLSSCVTFRVIDRDLALKLTSLSLQKMKKLSGSSGRSLLLLITNIALMFFGAITVASGSILIGIFLLHLFTFTSQLFLVVPVVLITSGTLTIIVAIFGLSLFKRKNEKRCSTLLTGPSSVSFIFCIFQWCLLGLCKHHFGGTVDQFNGLSDVICSARIHCSSV